MLWSMIATQSHQVLTMQAWLGANGYAASAACSADEGRKLAAARGGPSLRAPAAARGALRGRGAAPRRLDGRRAGAGRGTSADPCVTTNCERGVCTFTARIDPHAGPRGYWKFDECGDVAAPVLGLERGSTYVFSQADHSNWYHPMAFAYAYDAEHEGDDDAEMEPDEAPPGGDDSCERDDSCPAPAYYEDGEMAGGGDLGFGDYEDAFRRPKGAWRASAYHAELTLAGDYDGDLFYYCYVHGGMSGRIKVLEGGAKVQEADEPPLPADYYKVPSAYDASCGGYDLEAYRDSGGRCAHETFLCTDDALPKGSFGDCLIAMDCAMDYEMRSFRRPSFFRARRPSPRRSGARRSRTTRRRPSCTR